MESKKMVAVQMSLAIGFMDNKLLIENRFVPLSIEIACKHVCAWYMKQFCLRVSSKRNEDVNLGEYIRQLHSSELMHQIC
jgi:hypothetical protein